MPYFSALEYGVLSWQRLRTRTRDALFLRPRSASPKTARSSVNVSRTRQPGTLEASMSQLPTAPDHVPTLLAAKVIQM